MFIAVSVICIHYSYFYFIALCVISLMCIAIPSILSCVPLILFAIPLILLSSMRHEGCTWQVQVFGFCRPPSISFFSRFLVCRFLVNLATCSHCCIAIYVYCQFSVVSDVSLMLIVASSTVAASITSAIVHVVCLASC